MESILEINALSPEEKENIYKRLIPPELFDRFHIDWQTCTDGNGKKLIRLSGQKDWPFVKIELKRALSDQDPVFSLELSDTPYQQIELSFIIVNDPDSPRFHIDKDPEGRETYLGTSRRNLKEEGRAMEAGMAPGQIRAGLRVMGRFFPLMEEFLVLLNKQLCILEPLYYHNATFYEKYGFGYLKGLKKMEELDAEFAPDGLLSRRLDGSTPFRVRGAEKTHRGRSWAIHDGILGEPWDPPLMYKTVGKHCGICTFSTAAY